MKPGSSRFGSYSGLLPIAFCNFLDNLDEGVLVVEVDDPAWATQVKFLVPTIIERLREVARVEIERVDVRVDRRNSRGAKY